MENSIGSADSTVVNPDPDAKISAADLNKMEPERKEKYLRRMKREDEANKKNFEKTEEWLEIVGAKVLIKFKSAIGSIYSLYWFNGKKFKAALQELKEKGYGKYSEHGEIRDIPLKFIDGKPFILKKKG